MKQAILITAYKNLDHLKDLADFFDEDFEIYIHFDRKSKVSVHQIKVLQEKSNIKLISRKYKVNWGGLNHLKSILHLAKEASKNKNLQYFHLISGHDFPIKPLSHIKGFIKQNSDKSFISHFPLPTHHWFDGGLSRLEYYNFYDILDGKKYRHYIFKIVEFQKKMGFKRRLSKNLPKLYGGETWWSMSKEALTVVLNYTEQNPKLLKRLKHSFCSEEIYIQTVLLNSTIKDKIVNKSLSFIDWSNKNGNFPANLIVEDKDRLLQSDKLFARKFEYPQAEVLKEALLKSFANNA